MNIFLGSGSAEPRTLMKCLMGSTEKPAYFSRWPVNEVMNQVAANIASLIEDGDCIGFNTGSLIEAVSPHLTRKRHLGIHTFFLPTH